MTNIHTSKNRLLSLDVFRGITVAAMILVNNPGNWGFIYSPLEHAEWNGCTPTDLIFPFFLFIMGVSIVYALDSKKEAKDDQNKLLLKILKRATILFLLGFSMNLFPFFNFSHVRIFGVLQRIAIVFLFCGIIFIKTDSKTQFKIMTAILVAYWAIMTLIPVPGIGYPNLQTETNLAAWLDRLILTTNHTWINSKTWDPEGILSTLPAIGTGIFGLIIGGLLKDKTQSDAEKVAWIFSLGTLAVILGLIWDLIFPINKSLWTSSYVFYSGGLAAMGLALCYWLIDVKGYKKFTLPFVVYGVNAITVFFLSGIIARSMNLIHVHLNGKSVTLKGWFYEQFYTPNFSSPYNASLAGAITFVFIWWLILWLMYRKNIIIKV